MRCKTCDYSLLNLTGPPHRCPECGNAFDPDDPASYRSDHRLLDARHVGWLAVLAYILSLCIAVHLAFAEHPGNARTLLFSPIYAAVIAVAFMFPICFMAYTVIRIGVRVLQRIAGH